jgi:predicted DCC family thiol-disulfide oxidoreductase YuxK
VLFDGECGLCARVVRRLLRLDREGRLRFAPLQSASAQAYLRRHGLPLTDFETLVYVPDWSAPSSAPLLRTAAVIGALHSCGRVGRALGRMLRLFPASLRDAVYRVIGRWRYRIFGPARDLPANRAEWARRFLP